MFPAHNFHIPVMGISFTIDTPLKVAKYGISSVLSAVDDELCEQMRKIHAEQSDISYTPILKSQNNFRSERITAYLNLLNDLVKIQFNNLKKQPFKKGSDIVLYFELLPHQSFLKKRYEEMLEEKDENKKLYLQEMLRAEMVAGSIDINIMSKLDKLQYTKEEEPIQNENSDALAALRGFAESNLKSSVVISAGYNPRLFKYMESFSDFYPNTNNEIIKSIILKVSDYRSALTQGKLLAKKGLWVSEFRIESGLNCGGHAFATEGILIGPILEEFKNNRDTLLQDLFELYNAALESKGFKKRMEIPTVKISVQGGIGTANENQFLLDYYKADSTGWGSPFLLVPEVTLVDNETLQQLSTATKEDFYLSNSSPLGVLFNNFKKSTSELQRVQRIQKNRPGSPCHYKTLSSNTEFTKEPICTASRQYQHLKLAQLKEENLPTEEYQAKFNSIVEKECLCEGLAVTAYLNNQVKPPHKLTAVSICPGPNLAFFSGQFSLKQMVDHIYGRINILNNIPRPHMFVNELKLYVDYFKAEQHKFIDTITAQKAKQLKNFQDNLFTGIQYYNNLIGSIKNEAEKYIDDMRKDILQLELKLKAIPIPIPEFVVS